MNSKFLDFVKKFAGEPVALAVSGGVDSIALLYWYATAMCQKKINDGGVSFFETDLSKVTFRESHPTTIILHVNHHLRPESTAEAEYVRDTAAALGLRCVILDWTGDKPTAGLEAAARKARYNLMLDWCRDNNVGVLMTAHQADDQIETFLMNLGRGSGVYGLGGIRAESERDGIIIARPMLGVFRAELQTWCDLHKVKYFKDAMNDDENFTRVKIRKNRHLLRDRLGISDARILLAVENLARAREALESEISNQQSTTSNEKIIFPAAQLFSLPRELQLKFLAEMLKRGAGAEYSPRLGATIRLLDKLSGDTIATLSGCTIRRLGEKILITTQGNSVSFREKNKKRKS
jgi:tRNA(Ile)-lysidine synthase